MNKLKNLLVLIFLGLLCFSCDNSNKQKNPKAGYGTVTFNANCSRTVQEDFKNDDFDNISFYAKETDSLLNWTDLEPIIKWDNYSSFSNAEVSMKVGTYDFYLEASMSMGDVKFESNVLTNVTISETESTSLFFKLKLVNSGDDTGRVIIKYNFGEKNVNTAKFELNKITYENTDPEDPSAEKERKTTPVTVNSSSDYVIKNSTDGDVSYYCDFNKTLQAGNYELIARFETSTGGENGVGEVVEYPTSINVSENIDSVGEFDLSEYFTPFYRIMYAKDLGEITAPTRYSMYDEIIKTDFPSLESTKGTTNYYPFVSWCTDSALTKEFNGITKYGEYRGNLSLYPKWKLNESQYLLFDYVPNITSGVDYYKFSMFENNLASAVISDENPQIPNYEFPVIGGPDFFYYYSDEGLEKSNDSGVVINLEVGEEQYISSIFYDNETDTLYGRCDEYKYINNGGSSSTSVYEKSLLCKYNEDENIFTPIYETKLVNGENSFMGMSNNFAVHNNKMYFCLKDTYNVKIYIYDGIIGDDEKDDEQITIDVSDLAGATSTDTILDYLSINDMMFVDGKLYILWSCNYEYYTYNDQNIKTYFGDDPARLYRFGGVLCVNENGIVETLFTSTAFPTEVKHIRTSKNEFTDPAVVYYYGPSAESDKACLFGPTKFIAIKPKKLVFADEGIFVYNDETDPNNPKYKNINRVVEIDLADNQIAGDPINTEVSFSKDMENVIEVYSSYSSIYPAE